MALGQEYFTSQVGSGLVGRLGRRYLSRFHFLNLLFTARLGKQYICHRYSSMLDMGFDTYLYCLLFTSTTRR
jgi:hypothetical protein